MLWRLKWYKKKRSGIFQKQQKLSKVLTVLYLRTMKTQALVLVALLILASFVVDSNCFTGPIPRSDSQLVRKRRMLLDKVEKIFQ